MKYLLLLFLLASSVMLFPQSDNSYQIDIKNVKQTNSKTYEFEVYIKTPKSINLTSYQCIFTFNQSVINSGDLKLEYISNSSQLVNKPIKSELLFVDNQLQLAFASGPGLEQINGQKMIGKFRLSNTSDFTKDKLDLQWLLSGETGTIFSGTNYKNITTDFIFKPKP